MGTIKPQQLLRAVLSNRPAISGEDYNSADFPGAGIADQLGAGIIKPVASTGLGGDRIYGSLYDYNSSSVIIVNKDKIILATRVVNEGLGSTDDWPYFGIFIIVRNAAVSGGWEVIYSVTLTRGDMLDPGTLDSSTVTWMNQFGYDKSTRRLYIGAVCDTNNNARFWSFRFNSGFTSTSRSSPYTVDLGSYSTNNTFRWPIRNFRRSWGSHQGPIIYDTTGVNEKLVHVTFDGTAWSTTTVEGKIFHLHPTETPTTSIDTIANRPDAKYTGYNTSTISITDSRISYLTPVTNTFQHGIDLSLRSNYVSHQFSDNYSAMLHDRFFVLAGHLFSPSTSDVPDNLAYVVMFDLDNPGSAPTVIETVNGYIAGVELISSTTIRIFTTPQGSNNQSVGTYQISTGGAVTTIRARTALPIGGRYNDLPGRVLSLDRTSYIDYSYATNSSNPEGVLFNIVTIEDI